MPDAPAIEAPTAGDTPPTSPLPPDYGRPRWWLWAAVVLVLLALLVAVVLAARLVRAAWRRARTDDRTEVFTVMDLPPAGPPTYRVEFYDGNYRQLSDRRLAVALVSAHGPAADATLNQLARQLADEVDARDGQRCFDPVVELYDRSGRLVRRYRAGAA